MASRYELSEVQWERIKDALPGRVEHVGRTAADNRQFVNGVLWVLRSGARWSDLPERYGKYKSVHTRFMRWARSGVWERIFADLVRDKKNQYLMIDSTIVRAHQQAAGPQKKGCEDPALGRSRGGLSTKIHLLADEDGLPLEFRITPGQAGEYAPAAELLQGQRAEAVIADKGYDADAIVAQAEDMDAMAVIPSKCNRKQQRAYDRELYKRRNRIERCFNKLKHFRRFATRYCKTIQAFRSFTALACAWLRLKLYVDTP
ncbi:MAG TPA: IS5 family transposase [Terracidiphilus sp.]